MDARRARPTRSQRWPKTRLLRQPIAWAVSIVSSQWVREDSSNERVFWGQIYPKLLPLQVAGDSSSPVVSKLIVEWQPSSE